MNAATCTHCGEPVRPDGRDDWIHEHGLYRCQSNAVAYGHLAHPADVPCRADGPNPCLGAHVTEWVTRVAAYADGHRCTCGHKGVPAECDRELAAGGWCPSRNVARVASPE